MGEKEQVIDIKKIVEVLELAGCEVREIQRPVRDPNGYTGEYSLTIVPCYKKKDREEQEAGREG